MVVKLNTDRSNVVPSFIAEVDQRYSMTVKRHVDRRMYVTDEKVMKR